MDIASASFKFSKGVTTAVLEKLDQVERVQKRELKFARRYKESIKDLADDASDISSQLNAILEHGHPVATSKLLNTTDALDKLVTLLEETRNYLKLQEDAAIEMLTMIEHGKPKTVTDKIVDAVTIDNHEAKVNEVMEEAVFKLQSFHDGLKKRSKNFRRLYEICMTGIPALVAPSCGPTDVRTELRNLCLRDAQLAFYDRPFAITLAEVAGVDVSTDVDISLRKSRSAPFVSALEQMGQDWVETNSSHSPTLDELANLEVSVLEEILSNIKVDLSAYLTTNDPKAQDGNATNDLRCLHLANTKRAIEKEIARVRNQHFSIAFCGMAKAGKSSFLNALIGQELLPSDVLPSTAWPCRVLHVRGQSEPTLSLDTEYFENCIEVLREKKYGAQMEQYMPPEEEDEYAALFGDNIDLSTQPLDSMREATNKREIYNSWVDLHAVTKCNLLRLEQPDFVLLKEATGREDVIELLGLVNDIVRLCGRFGIRKPESKAKIWPLIKVEFKSLRERVVVGEFEFIDLPGIGEKSKFYEYEDLVREVAKETNAVVPIVSFGEVSKGDWRQQLPAITKTALNGPPDLVICTYLDHVQDSVNQLTREVAKAFMPTGKVEHVLPCATMMGVSADILLEKSRNGKPLLSEIWEVGSLGWECAQELLGTYPVVAERSFNNMSPERWLSALQCQLLQSQLPSAIDCLVGGLVATAHKNSLEMGNLRICKLFRKAIQNDYCLLIQMQRSQESYENAYNEFVGFKQRYQSILDEWQVEHQKGREKSTASLNQGFSLRLKECKKTLDLAIEKLIKDFLDTKKMVISTSKPGEGDIDNLAFEHPIRFNADLFLEMAKQLVTSELANAKKSLVQFVRNLAAKSHISYFKSLQEKIKTQISDNNQQLTLKLDIVGELHDKGTNLEALAFTNIRQTVLHTVNIRHTGSTAYRAIQDAIAGPFLKKEPIDVLLEAQVGHTSPQEKARSADDLGFILRAPITVIASLSWVLGSPIWPFLHQSEKVLMNKSEFLKQLHENLTMPLFRELQDEGQTTLISTMSRSWEVAKSAVEEELKSEEERYSSEGKGKGMATATETLPMLLASLLNFISAESALSKVHSDLKSL